MHALVPRRAATLRTPAYPVRSAEAVSAVLWLERIDRRRRIATFMLRVSNGTDCGVVCRTAMVSRYGEMVSAYQQPVEIESRSTYAARVAMRIDECSEWQSAMAEVTGSGARYVVQAPIAPIRKPRTLSAISAGCFASGIIALCTAAALLRMTPHIAALTLPPQAPSGSTVRAQYAASGVGSLAYVVTEPGGRPAQSGVLRDHSGSLFISLPPGISGTYTLRMSMQSRLGSVSETRAIGVISPVRRSAWIQSISVQPSVAHPGEAIRVSYMAGGQRGYVRLIGTDGTVWQQQPFSRTGETALTVPPSTRGGEMRVALRVTEGSTAAQSMAGVAVQSASNASPGQDASGAPVRDDAANDTFALVSSTVRSGEPIAVRVITPRNGLRLVLTDMQAHEITAVAVSAVAPNAIVTLPAQRVSTPTLYTVVATFTDTFGDESIVEPVTVLP